MAPRRSNHEGSIYQRTSDGLWMGVAHVGYDSLGKPLRRYVSSKKRTEVGSRPTEWCNSKGVLLDAQPSCHLTFARATGAEGSASLFS
jgi:hypothetical protein